MKQFNILKKLLLVFVATIGTVSCEDFLDRPDKENYTLSDFYQTDEQCLEAVNPLYTVPWFDFFRGWLGVGDKQAGNFWASGDPFCRLVASNDDEAVQSMSASLWAVNGRANMLIEAIDFYSGPGTTEAGRNTAKGEALVWKAMAYFFMVRIYGAVPIVHNNTELLGSGEYNTLYRATIPSVYGYIIKTLEKAIEWLPEKASQPGRIDKYCAYGLLAKVYLTKSGYGRNGDRNQDDLDKAKEYAAKVVNESERILMPEYSDIFRGHNNVSDESLIAWRWITTGGNFWTAGNDLQCDMAPVGFQETADYSWGGWSGPTIDLQNAFGETIDLTNQRPTGAFSPNRRNIDKRRKATIMMYGDVYEYFWRDHPVKKNANDADVNFNEGFDFIKFYGNMLGNDFQSSTGANFVKHLVGNNADHIGEFGSPPMSRMNSLATHILRLADVYLIYAEAILGNMESTSDAEALKVFNAVRTRAGVSTKSSISFEDIFLERRLELALEGDFWYDFVRLSYYKPDLALAKLNAQERRNYYGLGGYYGDQGWNSWVPGGIPEAAADGKYPRIDDNGKMIPRIDENYATGQPYRANIFTMPFPITDLAMNPLLSEEPVEYDLDQFNY
jgi:hypothetical protein